MTKTILAAATALLLATPVLAQQTGSVSGPSNRGRDFGQGQQPPGGQAGYQANTYVRRPSRLTPTDVGNMAFPDPSLTPAGNLPPVPVGR